MRCFLTMAAFAVCVQIAQSQSTIAYFPGPVSPYLEFPYFGATDLNADGESDLRFTFGMTLCTTDVPTSACWTPYYFTALSTNQITMAGGNLALFPAGTLIRSTGVTNGAWNTPGGSGYLMGFHWNYDRFTDTYSTRWSGPLADQPDSYLGILFHAADCVHYGWVHVALRGSPVIVDWAYETRPNTAIRAGAKPVSVPQASPEIARPGQIRLKWHSEIGKGYQVQAKDNVNVPLWTNLGFVVVGTTTNAAVDIPITGEAKFFRIVEAD